MSAPLKHLIRLLNSDVALNLIAVCYCLVRGSYPLILVNIPTIHGLYKAAKKAAKTGKAKAAKCGIISHTIISIISVIAMVLYAIGILHPSEKHEILLMISGVLIAFNLPAGIFFWADFEGAEAAIVGGAMVILHILTTICLWVDYNKAKNTNDTPSLSQNLVGLPISQEPSKNYAVLMVQQPIGHEISTEPVLIPHKILAC